MMDNEKERSGKRIDTTSVLWLQKTAMDYLLSQILDDLVTRFSGMK